MDPRVFFDGAAAVMNMNTHAEKTRHHTSIRKARDTHTECNVPKDDQHELYKEAGVYPPVDGAACLYDPGHEGKEKHDGYKARDRFTKEPFWTHPIDKPGQEEKLKDTVGEAK